MGGGRRNKNGGGHHNHHHNNNNSNNNHHSKSFNSSSSTDKARHGATQSSTASATAYSPHEQKLYDATILLVSDEKHKTKVSFLSWKEVGCCFVLIASLGILCLILGMSAGTTISIHYYQDAPPSLPAARKHRATNMDRDMVARNVLSTSNKVVKSRAQGGVLAKKLQTKLANGLPEPGISDDLSSSSSSSSSSQKTTPVVQESPPLHTIGQDSHQAQQSYLKDVIYTEAKIKPKRCVPDSDFEGFSDYDTLYAAVQEVNALSDETFLRWNDYFATQQQSGTRHASAFVDESLYYEEDVWLPLCPKTVLHLKRSDQQPLFINARNVILECPTMDCTFYTWSHHIAFGPFAKNILVRGITLEGATTTSSVTLHQDGADVAFEHCRWRNNAPRDGFGSVADVNSSSIVTFFDCDLTSELNGKNSKRTWESWYWRLWLGASSQWLSYQSWSTWLGNLATVAQQQRQQKAQNNARAAGTARPPPVSSSSTAQNHHHHQHHRGAVVGINGVGPNGEQQSTHHHPQQQKQSASSVTIRGHTRKKQSGGTG